VHPQQSDLNGFELPFPLEEDLSTSECALFIFRSSMTDIDQRVANDIIYELVLYIKHHYSKAPSPGVNDCFVSFVFFGIGLPVKSF